MIVVLPSDCRKSMGKAYWRENRSSGILAPTKQTRGDLSATGIFDGRDILGYLPDIVGRSFLRESNLLELCILMSKMDFGILLGV